jgi:hypothetical protein
MASFAAHLTPFTENVDKFEISVRAGIHTGVDTVITHEDKLALLALHSLFHYYFCIFDIQLRNITYSD